MYWLFVSNHSPRIATGTGDDDWSKWAEDWAESHDHVDQSEWTGWSNEQLAAADSNKSSTSRKPTVTPAEKNLIDFDVTDDSHRDDGRHGSEVGTEVADCWDADVWADVDDDNWEPLETPPPAISGVKRD